MAECDDIKALDDPTPPPEAYQTEPMVESMVEDSCAANEPPELAHNCEVAILPSSSSEKRTLRRGWRNNRGERQKLQAVVIPPLAKSNSKKRRILESAVDSARKETKNPNLQATHIRPPADEVKRQANLTIEVPPLPVDWWAWEEIHSPLTDDWLNSSSAIQKAVSRRVQKHQPRKQLKQQSKKRPRGRPRRIRHPPITNDLHPNQTLARQPASPDLPERREQEKFATSADERPLLTRKRKSSSRENVLEQNPVECDPPSNGPEHSSGMPLTSHKKVRFTSPTVFPPLLSVVDQIDTAAEEDCTPLLPWIKDSTTFNPGGIESECDPISNLGDSGWYMSDDWSMDETSTSRARDDRLFSQFLPAGSSPISSASVSEAYSGETISVSNISDLRSPLDDADGDSNLETLFNQYLRSPSTSPPPSPSPTDATSQLSGITLNDA